MSQPAHTFLKHYTTYAASEENSIQKKINGITRDFLIYRFHSNQTLVQDVLRIEGYEQGTGLCHLYQHTTQKKDVKVKQYEGNILFNNNAFYIIVSAPPHNDEWASEFGFFIFPFNFKNDKRIGTVCGLTDRSLHPMAGIAIMSDDCPKRFDDPKSEAKVLDEKAPIVIEIEGIIRKVLADKKSTLIADNDLLD